MGGSLTLIQGPAGGGKSAVSRDLLESGEVQVVADVTGLWSVLSGAQRDPETGRYPERRDDDPALSTARYVQVAAVRHGLREGFDVGATTSRRDQVDRWQGIAAGEDAAFRLRTVDPGLDVVTARLADPATGVLSEACGQALGRWFG